MQTLGRQIKNAAIRKPEKSRLLRFKAAMSNEFQPPVRAPLLSLLSQRAPGKAPVIFQLPVSFFTGSLSSNLVNMRKFWESCLAFWKARRDTLEMC